MLSQKKKQKKGKNYQEPSNLVNFQIMDTVSEFLEKRVFSHQILRLFCLYQLSSFLQMCKTNSSLLTETMTGQYIQSE